MIRESIAQDPIGSAQLVGRHFNCSAKEPSSDASIARFGHSLSYVSEVGRNLVHSFDILEREKRENARGF